VPAPLFLNVYQSRDASILLASSCLSGCFLLKQPDKQELATRNKTMGDTAGNVKANHVSFGVDPRSCGAREVAGGESALVEHQAVLDASCNVRAGDIALGVDTGSQQFRMRQARRWPALWLCRSVEARRGASVPVARLTGCRMGDTFISACSPSRFPAPARHESSRYAPAKCSRNATLRNPALNPRPSGPVPRVAPDRAMGHSAGSGPTTFAYVKTAIDSNLFQIPVE
jgi:hypothetical protein